jgi:NAD(P)-dependent dehydrogenase (short-subunit alcohol dehydrogenase family)
LLKGDALVVVSSSASDFLLASVCAAIKYILLSLWRYWANAFYACGIRVNALVPGPLNADFRSFLAKVVRTAFASDMLSKLTLAPIVADEAVVVALFLFVDDAGVVAGV